MGNTKRERKVYKNTKEESRQLHDLLNCTQEEKTNKSKVQKEQLNARFMSFYNSSNTWDRSKKGSLEFDIDRLNAIALRSEKVLSFAAVWNNRWSRMARSAASVVSTSNNSEKNVVEVTLHQGVSILVEGFLFEANTNLPQNNNTIFNNSGNHGNLSDSLEWVRLYTRLLQNSNETYNNEKRLSLSTHLLPNNKTILNSDKSCDNSRRSCLDLLTQMTGMAPDCSVTSAQRGFEQITLLSRHVTRHTNSHQLREHFK